MVGLKTRYIKTCEHNLLDERYVLDMLLSLVCLLMRIIAMHCDALHYLLDDILIRLG